MRKSTLLVMAVAYFMHPQSVIAQSIFESGGVDSMAVGLGAGLGASIGKGMLVNQTYQAGVNAEMSAAQVLQLRTRAIDQYMKVGCEYQAKKQWQNAEKSFRYVLQVSTLRDGPTSPKASPSLQHLAQVSAAQGNLFDAIGFQERVVGLAKNQKIPEPASIISAQIALSNYYLEKQDYRHAEPVLQESYALAQKSSALSLEKRQSLMRTYAKVLRKVGKVDTAEQIDPSLDSVSSTALPPLTPPSVIPVTTPASITSSTANSTVTGSPIPMSEQTTTSSEPGGKGVEIQHQPAGAITQPTESSSEEQGRTKSGQNGQ